MSSLSDHAAYRDAVASVGVHLKRQHEAELAVIRHHQAGRDDAKTLARLVRAVEQAEADVAWCRCLVVACGEVVKGCTFEEANRSHVDRILDLIDKGIAT